MWLDRDVSLLAAQSLVELYPKTNASASFSPGVLLLSSVSQYIAAQTRLQRLPLSHRIAPKNSNRNTSTSLASVVQ
jgi:hypothetical protein